MDLAAQRLRHGLSPAVWGFPAVASNKRSPLTCTNYNNNHHICISCDSVSAAPIKVITFCQFWPMGRRFVLAVTVYQQHLSKLSHFANFWWSEDI